MDHRVSLKERQSKWKEKMRAEYTRRVAEVRLALLKRCRAAKPTSAVMPARSPDFEPTFEPDFEQFWSESTAHLTGDNYEEMMCALEESFLRDMEKALRQEEESLLRYASELQSFEENSMSATVEECDAPPEGVVTCPVCRRALLHQNKHVIFCGCGLRVDTQNDQIDLCFVKQRLGAVWSEHLESGCAATPSFSCSPCFGVTGLVMNCEQCHAFTLVF
eukprot:jgi/Mesvir1/16861/Mv15746-RA.1